ncbi:hypothetical protein F0M18_16425 [Pseudohalioglobus sediminis]|uniref:Uncharacterized protein n=1 Tax=Pseudohalioglobus sediminis TaxID=2606449 RepID=A0A5B0WR03_9GAMM|nr:hypothetical protein [Pseudohalioglobus sediminis]KAA1189256.1 hypothetical protein F0M18_16425 [Pseudohalioglobus sediminis]
MSVQSANFAEIQKKYSAHAPTKIAPKPHTLWALADFYRYISKQLVVIYGDSNTPYQDILANIKALPTTEVHQLFQSYIDSPAGELKRLLLNRPSLRSLSSELSKINPVLRAVLLQTALGDREIVTFTQQFSDKFLNGAATRASMLNASKRAPSIGQIMHTKFRTNLKEIFERKYGNGFVLPQYWFGVEYAIPSRRHERGEASGFHLHGQITADRDTLPDIKVALYKIAECYDNPSGKRRAGGYRQRFDNLAVHFGLPSQQHSNGRGKTPCISTHPPSDWIEPQQYDYSWARYSAKDTQFTSYMAGERLGIKLGSSVFYESPGINQEAQACLRILRLFMKFLTQ